MQAAMRIFKRRLLNSNVLDDAIETIKAFCFP